MSYFWHLFAGQRWALHEEQQSGSLLSRAPIKLLNMASLRRRKRTVISGAAGVGGGMLGANTDTNRGISAAELRCLTIGVELVNRPGLVFLEDPFADLQWQDSEKVRAVCHVQRNPSSWV